MSVRRRTIPSPEGRLNERLTQLERDRSGRKKAAPAIRVVRTANQTIATSTQTGVNWTSEEYNNGWLRPDGSAIHSNSTNPSRIYIPIPGVYQINARAFWNSGPTGGVLLQAYIYMNQAAAGAKLLDLDDRYYVTTSDQPSNLCSTQYKFATDDFVELLVWQTRGANLDVVYNYSHMDLHYLGPG